ncbi:MAG: hypothetical protein QM775_22630 [Pirellulales bacterium]
MKRSGPARFSFRMVAVSLTSLVVVGAAIAAAIRESDAETPPAAGASPYATIAVENNDSQPSTSSTRIRFGAIVSSDGGAEAPGGPTTRGADFVDAYAQPQPNRNSHYAVQQAAAETPVRGAATAATSPTAGSPTSTAAASSDPFARSVPPAGSAMQKTPLPPPPNPLPTSAAPASPYGTTAAQPMSVGAISTLPSATTGDRYAAPPASAMPSASAATSAGIPASSIPSAAMPPASAYAPATTMPAAVEPRAAAPIAAPAPRAFENPPAARSAPSPFASQPPAAESPRATSNPDSSAPRTFSMPVAGPAGIGKPGEQALEGTQTPTLIVEKFAPPEIQIGKPAVFEILVRNTGTTVANNVEIHDVVPHGTTLTSSKPKAVGGQAGELVWQLGSLRPGDEATVQVELMPTTEGEIGSVATVHFSAAASARTVCTKPDLAIEVSSPRSVMVGDEVPLKIRVFNPGTGAATGVYLTEIVPAGMEHAAGGELEYEIGDLQPGETRELELALRAVKAGPCMNVIQGKGDGRVAAETKTQFEIVAPGACRRH